MMRTSRQNTLIRWWDDASFVERVIIDLVAAELSALRPGLPKITFGEMQASTHLVNHLGADSLELMTLASSLNELVHLHEAGFEDGLMANPTIGNWTELTQDALCTWSEMLTFRTSGSAGVPKRCTHSLIELCEEVKELSQLFKGRRRILTVTPAHHIYGFLFSILLPQARDPVPMTVVNLRGKSPAQLARIACNGDLVIGFPQWWKAFVRAGVSMPPGVEGVTSTAPCSEELSTQVLACGFSHLYQIYGSSETAGIGWRSDSQLPYQLFRHIQRDDTSESIRRVLGSQLIECQDRLIWQDVRHFRIAERLDAAVQVGGVNVFPSRVREVLLRCPSIADVAVRLMAPDEGERLKAYVVPHAGVEETSLRAALERLAASSLSTSEQPRAYSFGSHLPSSEFGKLADWRIFESDS